MSAIYTKRSAILDSTIRVHVAYTRVRIVEARTKEVEGMNVSIPVDPDRLDLLEKKIKTKTGGRRR